MSSGIYKLSIFHGNPTFVYDNNHKTILAQNGGIFAHVLTFVARRKYVGTINL